MADSRSRRASASGGECRKNAPGYDCAVSQPLPKGFLEQAARRSDQGRIGTVEVDRACLGCGYNLRGLSLGGRCPECGMPVQTPSTGDDPLSLMPIQIIKTFRRGTFVVVFALACFIVIEALLLFGVLAAPVGAGLRCAVSALWLGSAWLVTPALDLRQARGYGFAERGVTRRLARWLQLGWVLTALVMLLQATTKPPVPAFIEHGGNVLIVLGLLSGYAGFICLNVMLQRLARWVRDDTAAGAMNLTLWALPAALIFNAFELPVPLIGLVILAFWLAAVIGFPYGLFLLSRSVMLSVGHAREHQQRLRRRAEREERYHAEVDRRMAGIDAANRKGAGT